VKKKYNIQQHVWGEKHMQAVKRYKNEKSAFHKPFLQQLIVSHILMPIDVQNW